MSTPTYRARPATAARQATIEAYVPAKDAHGALLDPATWARHVRSVEDAVCAVTEGGCTSYAAVGVWNGTHEPVRIIRGAFPAYRTDAAIAAVSAALGAYGSETRQETVGFTLDGQWYFVERADAEAAE